MRGEERETEEKGEKRKGGEGKAEDAGTFYLHFILLPAFHTLSSR